jgi:steroid delta-isomerase-like uncharacterized protein
MNMSTAENKATARRYVEQIWNERRLDRFADFIAEDVVLHAEPETVGRENLKQRVAANQAAFSDFKQVIEAEIAEGDKVVQRWTIRAAHQGEFLGVPATGKKIASSGISILRFVDGKIAELWVEMDMVGMMQQLGAIPA